MWKGVYPFEYKDEKFNKISLPEGDFYGHLNIEDITDTDYKYSKRVCKYFEIKNVAEYHDLYVPSGTLLLADILENFQNMGLEIYELVPERFR